MRRDVGDVSIQASSSTTKWRRKKKINTMSTHARPPTRVWTLPRSAIPLVAGFVSGMTARVLVNPLDVLKVRLQAAQPGTYTNAVNAASRIIRQDGLRALMRGVQPGILLWAPYTAIQFGVVESLRSRLGTSAVSSSVCGAAAGLVATVVTFPLDTSRTVLAASSRRQFRGVVHALRAIVKRGGPAAMYSGLGATLCEILPFSAAEFALYYSINAAASSSSSTATLVNGAMSGTIAGIIARAFVHPIDVVKKRRQLRFAMLPDVGVAGLKSDPPWKTMRAIASAEGFPALMKGLGPSVVKAGIASGICFGVYEMTYRMVEEACGYDDVDKV